MSSLMLGAGIALLVVASAAAAAGRLPAYRAYGVLSISQVLTGTAGFIQGNTTAASISAAAAAYTAWEWWSGGGDGDIKRRRRQWSRHFRGVRRTAPAGSQ
ncbi:hypothetical protein [Streptomyces pacificus]|uniref:Uncharacterized protein n=1 Tax=Streptomyces pacificus TaxID=2705029 RepID=A0A6A0AQV1_9ACTN|nr:hypothetical protein [Streptomyces pacificus]GFH34274.1 hypothetical protein SCWH03_04880 [Streptomyces pacificus]